MDLSAWAQARKRLFDTGVFRQVDIQAVPIEPSPSPSSRRPAAEPARGRSPSSARVTLEELPPLRVRYGFEVDDELQPASETRTLRPGVAADATYRNVFGRAATTGLALRYTKDFEAARGVLLDAVVLRPSADVESVSRAVARAARHVDHAAVGRRQVRVHGRAAVPRGAPAAGGLQLQLLSATTRSIKLFNPDDPEPFDLTINIATADGDRARRHERRPGGRDARPALLVHVRVRRRRRSAQTCGLRSTSSSRTTIERSATGVVFATSGRLGLGAGYGQDLIQSEKFFAGGGNSVRGYKEDGARARRHLRESRRRQRAAGVQRGDAVPDRLALPRRRVLRRRQRVRDDRRSGVLPGCAPAPAWACACRPRSRCCASTSARRCVRNQAKRACNGSSRSVSRSSLRSLRCTP